MNEVFLIGKMEKEIEFNFIYKGNKIAKATSILELKNRSKIKIFGYDEVADWMYQKLKINDTVIVHGKFYSDQVKVNEIERIE